MIVSEVGAGTNRSTGGKPLYTKVRLFCQTCDLLVKDLDMIRLTFLSQKERLITLIYYETEATAVCQFSPETEAVGGSNYSTFSEVLYISNGLTVPLPSTLYQS